MSKNGGLGRKRIDNKDSKGLGKCPPNSRGEQCGNGRGLGKGKGESEELFKQKKGNPSNPYMTEDEIILPKDDF